jgi:hypothetical protein
VRALLVQPTFTHAAALVKVGSLLPFAAFAHEINAKSNIERLQSGLSVHSLQRGISGIC